MIFLSSRLPSWNSRKDRATCPDPLFPSFSSVAPDWSVVYPSCTKVSKKTLRVADAYVGSTVTGNTVSGSANHAASGVTVNTAWPGLFCVTVSATDARFTGSPVRSSIRASHASAAGIRDTTVPLPSTNEIDPSSSACAVSPLVFTGSSHDTAPTGRSRSTMNCSKPERSVSTTMSTPGVTPG